MLSKARKLFVEFFGCYTVSFVRFFWRFEQPKVGFFAVHNNTRNPFPVMFSDSFVRLFAMGAFFTVSHVLSMRCRTYIFPFVIFVVAILVVQAFYWPITFNAQPCYMRGSIVPLSDCYIQTAIFFPVGTRRGAFFAAGGAIDFPDKKSGQRIVVQYGAHESNGGALADFARTCFGWGSHSTLLRSFRSEAGLSATNALLPRLYATRGA